MSHRTSATGEERVKPALRRTSSGGTSKSSLEVTVPADVCMEGILDKLRLLEYESKFCNAKKPFRPLLHKHFFAVPSRATNAGQFSYFVNLVVWLLGLFGKKIPSPKDFDDPAVVCTNLINELKLTGFSTPSFSLTKLHKGYGDEVCGILNGLLDAVIRKAEFKFQSPVYPQYEEEFDDEESDFEDAELPLDEANSDSETSFDEQIAAHEKDRGSGRSKMSPEEWLAEIARVTPTLPSKPVADMQNWRRDLKQARLSFDMLVEEWTSLEKRLKAISQEIANTASLIASKEMALTHKCTNVIEEYNQRLNELHKVKATSEETVRETDALNAQQRELDTECHRISRHIEDKSASLSNSGPIVAARNSAETLQSDVENVKLSIGVLTNTLLQYSLRKRRDNATSDEDDF